MAFRRLARGVLVLTCLLLGVVSGPSAQTQAGLPAQSDAEFLRGAYLKDTPGVALPKIATPVIPKYTSDAMRAKIQGLVEVQVVVMPDGAVDRARIVKSLDKAFGLDEQALAAAKEFKFEPGTGTLDGRPVPVAVTVTLSFRLH